VTRKKEGSDQQNKRMNIRRKESAQKEMLGSEKLGKEKWAGQLLGTFYATLGSRTPWFKSAAQQEKECVRSRFVDHARWKRRAAGAAQAIPNESLEVEVRNARFTGVGETLTR